MSKGATYKVVDLFGNEEVRVAHRDNSKPNLFTDYGGFLDKFEAKKTTDDCYTPPDVYQLVLDYVGENFDLSGREIIRPFYPGGDFEAIDYPPNAVVIDNPPFSIIAKIARYYIARQIPFFLFAPHLTNFSSDLDCTHIIASADITYENGANVKTSFLSNMFGNAKVIGDGDLHRRFEALNDAKKVRLPVYDYPDNVLTVSRVAWIVERGESLRIDKGDVAHCRQLAAQKPQGKALFGSGFLISDKAAAEKAAAEKAAAEKAAAEKENVIIWELSQREREIIAALGATPASTDSLTN